MPPNSTTASSSTPLLPKVDQVLHVRAKSVLSCTFGRSANSSRAGVAPPPSYQTVTVGGVTALLHLNSRDGTVRTVGSVQWSPPDVLDTTPGKDKNKTQSKHGARVSIGDHTDDLADVVRKHKGVGKDLLLKPDTRAVYLPGLDDEPPLHFSRVAMPSGGFPYTVYTIADTSLPSGPTHAHICVGQLTIKRNAKPRSSSGSSTNLPVLLPFLRGQPKSSAPAGDEPRESAEDVVVRLELRTRDKALIDKIVFSSLLVVAGKHPVEADSRVETDRPVANENDAPPPLSNLATPCFTPSPSSERLPLNSVAPPNYQSQNSSRRHLLGSDSVSEMVGSDPFATPGAGSSGISMAAARSMSLHSSVGSSQSIASAA